jgi:aspartate/methionine/tyrosine aminotransferase
MSVPFDRQAIREILGSQNFDLRVASIREMNKIVGAIEERLGVRFIRMEFGVPGLPLSPLAVDAEHEALGRRGVGHVYAPFDGIPELKQEAARFVKLFLDLDVPAACCVPTVGAMEGCFASILLAARLREERNTLLCLEPGFPVNKLQLRLLGIPSARIDFYDHRGDRLVRAVEERVRQGDVCGILWSSPNNPSWIILTESELKGLGRICDRYGVLAIEDLAYFAMDSRVDYSRPGQPPYQPTVLRHTSWGVCLLSTSKVFSYAGQRIALAILSPELMRTESPDLARSCGTPNVGHALVHGILYPTTASVPESTQYGLRALLRAANAGDPRLFEPAREYARRAAIMKRAFLEHGFRLVYDNDLGQPLADGFYFTIAYPGFEHGADLLLELLHYGISAITLESAGSSRTEGLRACVSLTGDAEFPVLRERLRKFHEDHPA